MVQLIGINGRIKSGKDTVGKIIQSLVSGVNWNVRCANEDDIAKLSDWQIKKFAGKLKQIASLLTGIPVEEFEHQAIKESLLSNEWNYSEPYPFPLRGMKVHQMPVRELLQKLGTEAIRKGLHTNTWVNALFADYTPESKWIITDLRFPNEYDAIKQRGGICIRVNREGTKKANEHESETALDNHKFDYEIDNNHSIKHLTDLVKFILEREQIL